MSETNENAVQSPDFKSVADFASAANLAYLGDCVYELYVREYLVKTACQRPSVESLKYVTAHVQSGVVEKIMPILTEEEEAEAPAEDEAAAEPEEQGEPADTEEPEYTPENTEETPDEAAVEDTGGEEAPAETEGETEYEEEYEE